MESIDVHLCTQCVSLETACAANTVYNMATLSRLPFLTSRCGPRPSTIPAGYNHPTFRSSLGIGSRNVSLAYEKTAAFKPTRRLIRNIVLGTSIILALGAGCIYATDTRASAHRWIIPPMMRLLYPDAEDAHHAGVEWLKFLYRFGLHPRERGDPDGTGELVTQVAHLSRPCLRH